MFPMPRMFVLPPAQGALGGMVNCPFASALIVTLLVALALSAAVGAIWSVIHRRSRARAGVGNRPAVRPGPDGGNREAA
jgi:hypothetical protein